MTLDLQLRLLVANRHVVWLTNQLDSSCAGASRFSWRNTVLPRREAPLWGRVIAFSRADLDRAQRFVAPRGCVVLVESQSDAVDILEPLSGSSGTIKTLDGHVLNVFPSADQLGQHNETVELSKAPVKLMPLGWRRSRHRWLTAVRIHGWCNRKSLVEFVRQLAELDSEIAPHADFYLAQLHAGTNAVDPALHYRCEGAMLGLNPTPAFSTRHYLQSYLDVANDGMNPLLHFMRHGRREGRLAMAANTSSAPERRTPPQINEFIRRPPATDVWLAASGTRHQNIDWQGLSESGPCSLVLIATNANALSLWLKNPPDPVAARNLDLICVHPDHLTAPPKPWRGVVCATLSDAAIVGLSAAKHARIVFVADFIRPIPDALTALVRHIDSCDTVLTGRLLSPSGLLLTQTAGTRWYDQQLHISGFGLAPECFVRGPVAIDGPQLVAGTRQRLQAAIASWQAGDKVTATDIPSALACTQSAAPCTSAAAKVERVAGGGKSDGVEITLHWAQACSDEQLAIRAFLLDAIATWGSVRLTCLDRDLPLGDLEWLGLRGIACNFAPVGSVDPKGHSRIVLSVDETPKQGSTRVDTPQSVPLNRLLDAYSHWFERASLVRGPHLIPVGARSVLCVCSDQTSAKAAIGVVAASLDQIAHPISIVAVGKGARILLENDWSLDQVSAIAICDSDWLRFIDWPDIVVMLARCDKRGTSGGKTWIGAPADLIEYSAAARRLVSLFGKLDQLKSNAAVDIISGSKPAKKHRI